MVSQHFDPMDIQKNRVTGGLGYIVFFLPLVACGNSRFGRYCANQGLMLLLTWAAGTLALWLANSVLGWIPLLGAIVRWAVGLVRWLFNVGMFGVAAYFATRAIREGAATEVPFVGKYTLIR